MESLLKYNTFAIDNKCRKVYSPISVKQLRQCLVELHKSPLLVIGGGSNLLFTKDFNGNVLRPAIMGIIPFASPNGDADTVMLRCGAGEVWDDVVEYAVRHGYYGMENLSLIPGHVGASAVQNIGAYGKEVKDIIYKVECLEIATGRSVVFSNADCGYSYRHSNFKSDWSDKYVVTYVTYRLSTVFVPHLDYGNLRAVLQQKGIDKPTANDVRQAVIEIRQQKLPDPLMEGNAGSFFMNPIVSREKFMQLQSEYPNMPYYSTADPDKVKIPAGWMIETCGWKGRSQGRAGVHDKQALVLVNKGGATGLEIVDLCNAVCADVKKTFGIDLKPEVRIL